MAGGKAVIFILLFSQIGSYGFTMLWGDVIQKSYVPPRQDAKSLSVPIIGDNAPSSLLRALKHRPSIAIVYPACTECSIESPHLLKGERFKHRVIVLVAGATEADLREFNHLSPDVVVAACESRVSQDLGLQNTPAVVQVNANGRLTYLQAGYVRGNRLHEVVDGL